MNKALPHVALSLLELSNLIRRGRIFLSASRFQVFDSTSPEAITNLHAQVMAIFSGLPAINLEEDQSFFVARNKDIKVDYSETILNPIIELTLADIESLFPVTQRGREIFQSTQRLPGVVVHEPLFQNVWNEYSWNRDKYVAVQSAFDFADKFVEVSHPKLLSSEWNLFSSLVFKHDYQQEYDQLDRYVQLLHRVLIHKRDPVQNQEHYSNASDLSIITDLFQCAFKYNNAPELKEKCRDYHNNNKNNQQSLCKLLGNNHLRSLLDELANYFECNLSNITGILLFLFVKLQKQEGKIRSLNDLPSVLSAYIKGRAIFDVNGISLALILISISEEQDSVIEFIHRDRLKSYGLFAENRESYEHTRYIQKEDLGSLPQPVINSCKIEITDSQEESSGQPTEPSLAGNENFQNNVTAMHSDGDEDGLPKDASPADAQLPANFPPNEINPEDQVVDVTHQEKMKILQCSPLPSTPKEKKGKKRKKASNNAISKSNDTSNPQSTLPFKRGE